VETNPQKGIISHNSPIGAALMGHKIGDIIKIKTNTKEVEYKIVKIG
jgi:transcription elongation factor GreA